MHVCVYIRMYVHVYMRMCICMCVHTYVCMCVCNFHFENYFVAEASLTSLFRIDLLNLFLLS